MAKAFARLWLKLTSGPASQCLPVEQSSCLQVLTSQLHLTAAQSAQSIGADHAQSPRFGSSRPPLTLRQVTWWKPLLIPAEVDVRVVIFFFPYSPPAIPHQRAWFRSIRVRFGSVWVHLGLFRVRFGCWVGSGWDRGGGLLQGKRITLHKGN